MKTCVLSGKSFGRPGFPAWLGFAFCVSGILCMNSACNKSSGVNENKAFVTVSHVAPGFSALDVFYNGTSILGGAGLNYGEASGTADNPYVAATAGVRLLQITQNGDTVLQGNTAFQQGLHYSIFVYDTLKNDALKMFILQDNLQKTDTITNIRFINFSPGPGLNVLLTSRRDTVATGFQTFAGNRLDPSFYSYRRLHIGRYAARAFRDSSLATSIPLDSVLVDSAKSYTIFLHGYADSSGQFGLKLKSIRQN